MKAEMGGRSIGFTNVTVGWSIDFVTIFSIFQQTNICMRLFPAHRNGDNSDTIIFL